MAGAVSVDIEVGGKGPRRERNRGSRATVAALVLLLACSLSGCRDQDHGGSGGAAGAQTPAGGEHPQSRAATPATAGPSVPREPASGTAAASPERSPGAAELVAPTQPSKPDVLPPTTPDQLTSEARAGQVLLRWSPSRDDVGVVAYEVLRGDRVVAKVTGTTARESGLPPGVEHCYTVRAVDAAGNRSGLTRPVCGTPPDVAPPSVPGDVVATASSETEVVLKWKPSTDDVRVAGYEVFRGEALVSRVGETRASQSGLRAGTKYCYVVRAYDAAGNRSQKSAAACVSTADLTPPAAPASASATLDPQNDVTVAWSAASDNVGVAGYEVFRGEDLVATVEGTAARDTGLHATIQYCYSVRAFDAAGNRSPKSPPACVVPPDLIPPSVPPKVSAEALSERDVVVRWGAATDDVGVTEYEVFRGDALVAHVAEMTASESGLRAATRYCYTVRARDAAGNRSKPSNPVCVTTPDTTPPTTPGQPAATAASDRQVDLRWTASMDNVGVAGYEVYRTYPGAKSYRPDQLATKANQTNASEAGLEPAHKYCYFIVAYDAAGNRSAPAGPVCATTPDLTPPTTPENLVAAASSSREVLLGWDVSKDDVGVAGYEVVRGGVVVAKVERNQGAEHGLKPLTEYCYAVRAYDAAGNRSKPSAPACAKTPDPSLPEGPTRLRAEAIVAREVLLLWDPSATPGVEYVVYWERRGWRRIGTTPLTNFKVFGPVAREQHCYRVSAKNAEGLESAKMPELCIRAGEAPVSAGEAPPIPGGTSEVAGKAPVSASAVTAAPSSQ